MKPELTIEEWIMQEFEIEYKKRKSLHCISGSGIRFVDEKVKLTLIDIAKPL